MNTDNSKMLSVVLALLIGGIVGFALHSVNSTGADQSGRASSSILNTGGPRNRIWNAGDCTFTWGGGSFNNGTPWDSSGSTSYGNNGNVWTYSSGGYTIQCAVGGVSL